MVLLRLYLLLSGALRSNNHKKRGLPATWMADKPRFVFMELLTASRSPILSWPEESPFLLSAKRLIPFWHSERPPEAWRAPLFHSMYRAIRVSTD